MRKHKVWLSTALMLIVLVSSVNTDQASATDELLPIHKSEVTAWLAVGERYGGGQTEWASDVAVDPSGNIYVVGYTDSSDFPTTTGVYQPALRGSYDVYVAKYSHTGALQWATYIGGEFGDYAWGAAVSGDLLWITGYTDNATHPANGYPTTVGAYDTTHNGDFDAFVSAITIANGSKLYYSTYLGGTGTDYGRELAVDSEGRTWVVGSTNSIADFPVSSACYDPYLNGTWDAFLACISGSTLHYSTFLGGEGDEEARALAIEDIDASGEGYIGVCGLTTSSDFPTTAGAYDTLIGTTRSAFLSRHYTNSTFGGFLNYSTYIGGGQGTSEHDYPDLSYDQGSGLYGIGLSTPASEFPTSSGGYDRSYNGGYDGWLGWFDVSRALGASDLAGGTYIGTGATDHIIGVAFDSRSHLLAVGSTTGSDWDTVGERSQGKNSSTTRDCVITQWAPVSSFTTPLNYSTCVTTKQAYGELAAVAQDPLTADAVAVGQSTPGGVGTQDSYLIRLTLPDAPFLDILSWRNLTDLSTPARWLLNATPSTSLEGGNTIDRVEIQIWDNETGEDLRTVSADAPLDEEVPEIYEVKFDLWANRTGVLRWSAIAYAQDGGRTHIDGWMDVGGERAEKAKAEAGELALTWWQQFAPYIFFAVFGVAMLAIAMRVEATETIPTPFAEDPQASRVRLTYVAWALLATAAFLLIYVGGIAQFWEEWVWYLVLAPCIYLVIWSYYTNKYATEYQAAEKPPPGEKRERGETDHRRYRGLFGGLAVGGLILAVTIVVGAGLSAVGVWITNLWFWAFSLIFIIGVLGLFSVTKTIKGVSLGDLRNIVVIIATIVGALATIGPLLGWFG